MFVAVEGLDCVREGFVGHFVLVILCRLETDIRAARMEQSGCWVAKDAAVCAASSLSSTVRTPG